RAPRAARPRARPRLSVRRRAVSGERTGALAPRARGVHLGARAPRARRATLVPRGIRDVRRALPGPRAEPRVGRGSPQARRPPAATAGIGVRRTGFRPSTGGSVAAGLGVGAAVAVGGTGVGAAGVGVAGCGVGSTGGGVAVGSGPAVGL